MTQADREREKGARHGSMREEEHYLDWTKEDMQTYKYHIHTQASKRKKWGNRTGKLKMKELEAACGIRKILEKRSDNCPHSAGTSKESTNHRNWRWQRQKRRRHCANNAAGAAPINNGLSGKWQKGGIGTAKSPPSTLIMSRPCLY